MSWAGVTYKGHCQTGWAIRKDRQTGKWEAYCRQFAMPRYMSFPTWRRAMAYVEASTYGRHDRATTGRDSVTPSSYPRFPQAQHTPQDGRWDASWILLPQRYVLGVDCGSVALAEFDPDEKGVRWTLAGKGWCEALGLDEIVLAHNPGPVPDITIDCDATSPVIRL